MMNFVTVGVDPSPERAASLARAAATTCHALGLSATAIDGVTQDEFSGLAALIVVAVDENHLVEHADTTLRPLLPCLRRVPCAAAINVAVDAQAVPPSLVCQVVAAGAYLFPELLRVSGDLEGQNPFALEAVQARRRTKLPEYAAFAAALAAAARTQISDPSRGDAPGPTVAPEIEVMHFNILAADLERSLRFYEEVLGARYCYNLGPKKIVTQLNGFDFFIEQASEVKYPIGFHFGLRTSADGIIVVAEQLKEKGVEFVKGNGPWPGLHVGPDGTRQAFYFEDPDGLLIEVYSPEVAMLATNPTLIKR